MIPEFPYLTARTLMWIGAWGLTAGFTTEALALPLWATMPVCVLGGATVAFCCDHRIVRNLWLRIKYHDLLRMPVVVDEDQSWHVPVLLPNEQVVTEWEDTGDAPPRIKSVKVYTASGKVRSEWPTRR